MQDVDALQPVDAGGESSRVEVCEHRADSKNAVAAFDKGANLLIHQAAVVHTDILRVGFVEYALVHEHGGKGETRGLDHGGGLGAEAAARDQDAGQDAGAFRRVDGIGDRRHGSLDRNLV